MIKRTFYQFGFDVSDDEHRAELFKFTECLRGWLPEASISLESAKIDMSILTVEFEEAED